MARLGLALPLALLALVVAAPTASAAPQTRIVVPAEFVFEHGARPTDPGNCSAIVFIRWPERANAVATRVMWTTRTGAEREKTVRPPYNDTYQWVRTYQVAPGHHWAQVGKSWADGPRANDCAQANERNKAAWAGYTARVELLVDPDGIDWSMPERLTPDTPKEHFTDIGLPTKAFLDPRTWDLRLFLTFEGIPMPPPCNPGSDVRWRWVVEPRSRKAAVKGKVRNGCRATAKVTRLGDYDVTAIKERLKDGKWKKERELGPVKVTVDDIILAGVGDSSASGEGNPDFYFKACDRSVAAYQFKAALYVEQRDPRTSVTFMHPACSGARLDHMWKNSFSGTHGNTKLPPQLTQIARRLQGTRRDPEVDAAIAGIGVNDLAFGPVLGYCVPKYEGALTETFCPDQKVRAVMRDGHVKEFKEDETGTPLADRIAGLLAGLEPRYADFMGRVRAKPKNGGLGLRKPARVLLSQYPNFTRGPGGVCNTLSGAGFPSWSERTWGWMGDSGDALSATIREGSGLGYTPIPIDQGEFHGRGYCVEEAERRFVTIDESNRRQGNVKGAFHPNAAAHEIMAAPTQALLCNALYGNPTCEGRFRD